MKKKVAEADIVIVGGGVAGLWLLNRLRQLNYSVILLESKTLGGGQTSKSQGIIHGGMKYALQGEITEATKTIMDMPKLWLNCLQGKGILDLSHVPILSSQQYLWSNNKLTSKLGGFFASVMLKGHVEGLEKTSYPEIFQNPAFKGQVYALKEMVIDVNAMVRELVKPNQDVIFKIDPLEENQLHFDEKGNLASLEIKVAPLESIHLEAQRFIFVAGSGNEVVVNKLSNTEIKMQRRPLHMVMVKTDFNYALYGHCLGMSAVPRMTITTHKAHDGKTIWYLGGQIAEEGVHKDKEKQIKATRTELKNLFPWLDFEKAEFASFIIDRAEALQPDGKRPDGSFIRTSGNLTVAWPTKLAFAPKLAEEIIEDLQSANIKPANFDTRALRAWPIPAFAKPVWDEFFP
jgi:glycerol-3-phosphate dehydrogenase